MHMKGNLHRRIMEAKITAGNALPSETITATSVTRDDRWYCSSCKTDIRADQRQEHLGSLLHALRRGVIPTFSGGRTQLAVGTSTDLIPNRPPVVLQPTVSLDAFHCVPCGRTGKLVGYDEHIKGVSHRQEMLILGPVSGSLTPATLALHSRPGTWFCWACMVDLHADAREAHLAGNQHVPEQVHFALGIGSGSPVAEEGGRMAGSRAARDRRG